jgi:hypothetical protein
VVQLNRTLSAFSARTHKLSIDPALASELPVASNKKFFLEVRLSPRDLQPEAFHFNPFIEITLAGH